MDLWPAAIAALQRHRGDGNPGPVGTGQEYRTGHDRHARLDETNAAGHWLRVDRRFIAASAIKLAGALAVWLIDSGRVPELGRLVRALVDSDLGHHGDTDWRAGRAGRHYAAWLVQ